MQLLSSSFFRISDSIGLLCFFFFFLLCDPDSPPPQKSLSSFSGRADPANLKLPTRCGVCGPIAPHFPHLVFSLPRLEGHRCAGCLPSPKKVTEEEGGQVRLSKQGKKIFAAAAAAAAAAHLAAGGRRRRRRDAGDAQVLGAAPLPSLFLGREADSTQEGEGKGEPTVAPGPRREKEEEGVNT